MDFQLTSEQKTFIAQAAAFARQEIAPLAAKWDQDEHIPRAQIQKYADQGWFCLTVPGQYGGGGRTALDAVLLIEEIGRHCGISARILVDHNFGAIGTILNFGPEALRRRVLPAIASGERLMSIGMTEPEAGSDLVSLKTMARREDDFFILNGEKRWITGAGEREFTVVYARFDGIPGTPGIGAILVEQGMVGFSAGPRIPTLGVRGVREGVLIFEDVRVPAENLVVAPGSAFRNLMSAYNGQRVAASAVALGLAQGAFDYALAHAENRRQFGRRITDFQNTQFKLADMAMDIEAARLLVYRAAGNAKATISDRYESSLAKVYAAEMAIRVTNQALQLMGGEGFSREHPVERIARDARAFTLAGGSAEMQRLGIATKILKRSLPQTRER